MNNEIITKSDSQIVKSQELDPLNSIYSVLLNISSVAFNPLST